MVQTRGLSMEFVLALLRFLVVGRPKNSKA